MLPATASSMLSCVLPVISIRTAFRGSSLASQLQCEYSAGGRTDAFGTEPSLRGTGTGRCSYAGLDADQTEAAIKATVKLLNLIEGDYKDLESHV